MPSSSSKASPSSRRSSSPGRNIGRPRKSPVPTTRSSPGLRGRESVDAAETPAQRRASRGRRQQGSSSSSSSGKAKAGGSLKQANGRKSPAPRKRVSSDEEESEDEDEEMNDWDSEEEEEGEDEGSADSEEGEEDDDDDDEYEESDEDEDDEDEEEEEEEEEEEVGERRSTRHGRGGSAGPSPASVRKSPSGAGSKSPSSTTPRPSSKRSPTSMSVPSPPQNQDSKFCIVVESQWREEGGFKLFEVESMNDASRDGSRVAVCKEWVKSSEASSQEQTSFVSSEKSRKMTLEAGSWVAVGVNQLWRGEVAQDYTDEDEGILSLHAGEGCVVLSESDKGWSLIRTDDLDEGWFPTGFLRFIHAIVEVEDLESRISKAYSRLCGDAGGSAKSPGWRSPGGSKKNGGSKEAPTPSSTKRSRKKTERLSPTWSEDDAGMASSSLRAAHPRRVSERHDGADGHRDGEGEGSSRRRRSRGSDDGGEPAGEVAACSCCSNPNKKLGNSKTIVVICNKCESIIKQGWPFHQHRDPPQSEPGHPVRITNLCLHCGETVKREGFFAPKKEGDLPTEVAVGRPSIALGAIDPPACEVEGAIPFSAFTLKEIAQVDESLCECQFCGRVYHERCVRYCPDVYGDAPPRCPNPECTERWDKVKKRELTDLYLKMRARNLPNSPVAAYIQDYVDNAVFGNTQKKGHPKVVVRVVSNVQRLQESTPGFTKKYGKKVFPYQLKNIMCFMECGDGTDVCFLALVVAEFGPNAPEPNRNKAYISYIDSVQLYHTKACVLRGKDATCTTECSCPDKCKEERREIVRRVLIGYLDSVRLRGFEGLYIWAMPPNDLHHDYVFHMRPIQQHCPTPQQLDNWYTKLLNVAQEEGVISGFDSNAHKSDDPEDTSRNLPASLFGPDMSLRHVPQFPGGLKVRALEAVLAGGKHDDLLSPRSPDTSSHRRSMDSPSDVKEDKTRGGGRDRGSGSERRRERGAVSREAAMQSRERHMRAVEAMNSYLQSRSDMGSIFVIQYPKEGTSSSSKAPSKTPSSSKKPSAGSAAAKSTGAAAAILLEDDPINSVDADDSKFTLNECAHLCALFNDLHLQFNDLRNGKHSTMVMINCLSRQYISQLSESERQVIRSQSSTGLHHHPKLWWIEDKGKEGGGGGGSSGGGSGRGSGAAGAAGGSGSRKQKELALLLNSATMGIGGPRPFDVSRQSNHTEELEDALAELRERRKQNVEKAKVVASKHTCNSRCADSKCAKYDFEINCPVQCSCKSEIPDGAIAWDGTWVFCEFCCCWQHTCCMREDPNVCFSGEINATGICYDTDFNYMCHDCSKMPQVLAMRALGPKKLPKIIRLPPELVIQPAVKSESGKYGSSAKKGGGGAVEMGSARKQLVLSGKKRARDESDSTDYSTDEEPGGGPLKEGEDLKDRPVVPLIRRWCGKCKKKCKGCKHQLHALKNEFGSYIVAEAPKRGRPRKYPLPEAGGPPVKKHRPSGSGQGSSQSGGGGDGKSNKQGGGQQQQQQQAARMPAKDAPGSAKVSPDVAGGKDKSKRLEKLSQLTQLEVQRREEIYQSRFESKKPPAQLKVGQTVRCEDKGKVYNAQIKEIDSSKRISRVRVHFPGWNSRYDQWLPTDSPRLKLDEDAKDAEKEKEKKGGGVSGSAGGSESKTRSGGRGGNDEDEADAPEPRAKRRR